MDIDKLAPKVYLIDDDPIILEVLKTLAESVGIQPQLYSNARDFLNGYRHYPEECVVSDIRMPNISGLQLQKILQERFSVPPPLILVTGHAEISAAVEAMKQGAFDFVEKPISGQHFLDKIQAGLALSKNLHQQRLQQSAQEAQIALLTPKEKQILTEVLEGHSSKEIAADLGLSVRTVENHRSRMMEKLRVKSTVELVKRFASYVPEH